MKCEGVYLSSFPPRKHNTAMRVNVGDKMRSDKGVEGEMVGMTPDRYSAMVCLAGLREDTDMDESTALTEITPLPSQTAQPSFGRLSSSDWRGMWPR